LQVPTPESRLPSGAPPVIIGGAAILNTPPPQRKSLTALRLTIYFSGNFNHVSVQGAQHNVEA
jgi:hypothetical protein